MTTQNQKLIAFAQAVGADYKELKDLLTQLQNKVGELPQSSALSSQIQQAVQALRSELLNGVESEYDTLKELANKLKELANDEGLSGVIAQKLSEINQKITTLEAFKESVNGLDLVETYLQAKNSGGA